MKNEGFIVAVVLIAGGLYLYFSKKGEESVKVAEKEPEKESGGGGGGMAPGELIRTVAPVVIAGNPIVGAIRPRLAPKELVSAGITFQNKFVTKPSKNPPPRPMAPPTFAGHIKTQIKKK